MPFFNSGWEFRNFLSNITQPMYNQDDESFEGNLKQDIERFEEFLKGGDLGYLDVDRIESLIDH